MFDDTKRGEVRDVGDVTHQCIHWPLLPQAARAPSNIVNIIGHRRPELPEFLWYDDQTSPPRDTHTAYHTRNGIAASYHRAGALAAHLLPTQRRSWTPGGLLNWGSEAKSA